MSTYLRILLATVFATVLLAACGTPAATTDLTVTLAGTGTGTVSSEPAGIDTGAGADTAAFDVNTQVTLTATPTGASTFDGFSGVTCEAGSTSSTCLVTLVADTDVTATFTDTTPVDAPLTVNVNVANGATVEVTSDPAGIDTGAGDASATFPIGTAVTLTAVLTSDPVATGFAGWTGGDCDGVRTLTCAVTVGAGEPAVTANGNQIETAQVVIASDGDDAAEFLDDSVLTTKDYRPTGYVWAMWPRFDLGYELQHQATMEIGLRFANVPLAPGTLVRSAKLQVVEYDPAKVDNSGTSGALNLTIRGEAVTDPLGWTDDPTVPEVPSFGITGRTVRTTASATWAIDGAWVSGSTQVSDEFASVVQELVDRGGWATNAAFVLFLSNDDPDGVEMRRVWSAATADAADRPTVLLEYVSIP
ncbi:MAG: hypothetical protein P1P87_06150 [Trueperaceae bacterium]|nr:hypothetical protein [Trueperaceae bacterium]